MNRLATGCAHDCWGQSPQIGALRRLNHEGFAQPALGAACWARAVPAKRVVARAVHNANPRGEFVPSTAARWWARSWESELFGHVKGAFSGAVENKKGLVELADGGTAFFDEIGDLPLEMQVKFAPPHPGRRVPRRRRFALAQGRSPHHDRHPSRPTAERGRGRFRQDLFYRLNVVVVHLPPLARTQAGYPAAHRNTSATGGRPRACPRSVWRRAYGDGRSSPTTGPATSASCSTAWTAWPRLTPKAAWQMADLPPPVQYQRASCGCGACPRCADPDGEAGMRSSPRPIALISIPRAKAGDRQRASRHQPESAPRPARLLPHRPYHSDRSERYGL